MKVSGQEKPIKAIPKGVWETTHPVKEDHSGKSSEKTDLQGNGYPKKQDS